MAIEALSINELVTDRVTANGYVAFDIVDGVTLKTDWGIDNITTNGSRT